MERIWLSSPHIGEKEKEFVAQAFESNWVAPLGPNVDAFEKELGISQKYAHVLALNSGTAALHLALQVLAVKEKDIVLCQSFTFAASAFPIIYANAVPVFIDSERDTWNMDPVLLEKAITSYIEKGQKPAVIIVVHLYGMPAKMDEITAIAKKYGIPLIVDAAEALGSTYHGIPSAGFGDLSILSFNGNKIITTSGGGALLSNNPAWIKQARFLSTQAKADAPYYLHYEIGFNYRLSNVLAGIGRGQLMVLDDRVAKRRANYEFYLKELGNIEGIEFLAEPEGMYSNRWLTTIVFQGEKWGKEIVEETRKYMENQQIETRALWKPLHQQPVFSKYDCYNNGVSDDLFSKGLCLPSGSNLTEEQIKKVIYEFKKFVNG